MLGVFAGLSAAATLDLDAAILLQTGGRAVRVDDFEGAGTLPPGPSAFGMTINAVDRTKQTVDGGTYRDCWHIYERLPNDIAVEGIRHNARIHLIIGARTAHDRSRCRRPNVAGRVTRGSRRLLQDRIDKKVASSHDSRREQIRLEGGGADDRGPADVQCIR